MGRTLDRVFVAAQPIERAHLRAIKVIGSPLTPFENALAGGPNQGYTQNTFASRAYLCDSRDVVTHADHLWSSS
jgi:hypothetical protein